LHVTCFSGRLSIFFLMRRQPPRSTPFPYTTLFRSDRAVIEQVEQHVSGDNELDRHPQRCGEDLHLSRDAHPPDDQDDGGDIDERSEEHTSELQSRENLVCRLLLEKKNKTYEQSIAI